MIITGWARGKIFWFSHTHFIHVSSENQQCTFVHVFGDLRLQGQTHPPPHGSPAAEQDREEEDSRQPILRLSSSPLMKKHWSKHWGATAILQPLDWLRLNYVFSLLLNYVFSWIDFGQYSVVDSWCLIGSVCKQLQMLLFNKLWTLPIECQSNDYTSLIRIPRHTYNQPGGRHCQCAAHSVYLRGSTHAVSYHSFVDTNHEESSRPFW